MRKILMALAVMVVAIAVSAPHFASAASTKVSGFLEVPRHYAR